MLALRDIDAKNSNIFSSWKWDVGICGPLCPSNASVQSCMNYALVFKQTPL